MTKKAEFEYEGEHVLVLEPGRAERHYWRDIWAYRELFAILAWRDVAVRYKQTVIGIAWAVVRPFMTMVIFTIVFGRLAKLPSEGARPYPIMVFAGMLPWFLFSSILARRLEQPCRQRQLDRQGLFPAHHHSGLVRRRGAGRFRDQPRDARRAHGLVRLCAELADRVPARLRRACRAGEPRPGAFHHRAQREIPRLPIHHPVHRAVRALCLAGRLLQRRRA